MHGVGEVPQHVVLVHPGRTAENEKYMYLLILIYEPPHEKTNNLHMRKQRRRPASW